MDFANMSIKEIKAWLEERSYLPDEEALRTLQRDERSGVRSLLDRVYRMQARAESREQMWERMTEFERRLRSEGFRRIAGVDEAGRGPLAGPVVSAAVILPENFYLPGLNDSKKLSAAEREAFYEVIMKEACAVSVSMVSNDVIDEINILQAARLAMKEAVEKLHPPADCLLIDAVTVDVELPQVPVVGGDGKSISIAAASVIAKVTRDRFMDEMAKRYPHYGFDRNKGYGTREHLDAIARYGITPLHRRTFAGVKEGLQEQEKAGS